MDDHAKARRRRRYKHDPEYVEAAKARAKETRERLKRERRALNLARKEAFVLRWRAQGLDDDEIARRLDLLGKWPRRPLIVKFGEHSVPLYPLSVFAAEIGYCSGAIRAWEKAEVIPPATHKTKSGSRWYSKFYITLIQTALRGMSKSNRRYTRMSFKREVERLWRKNVVEPHGNERGLLAEVGARKVLLIR